MGSIPFRPCVVLRRLDVLTASPHIVKAAGESRTPPKISHNRHCHTRAVPTSHQAFAEESRQWATQSTWSGRRSRKNGRAIVEFTSRSVTGRGERGKAFVASCSCA